MKTILFLLLTAHCSLLGTLDAEPARPFGAGTITRTSDGRSAITTRYGNGTITRFSDGTTATTNRYGNGSLTRFSNGSTAITSRYGLAARQNSATSLSTHASRSRSITGPSRFSHTASRSGRSSRN